MSFFDVKFHLDRVNSFFQAKKWIKEASKCRSSAWKDSDKHPGQNYLHVPLCVLIQEELICYQCICVFSYVPI